MKLLSWNVNGIRSIIGKGFTEFVRKEDPDILCIQETKAHPNQVDLAFPQYEHYWASSQKKGYAGVAVFTKQKPLSVAKGLGHDGHDGEGRVLALEFERFYLVNVYTVNAQRGLTRLSYRQRWDEDFLAYLKKLEKKKPVIFCGDLNVAHKEIDLAHPKANRKNAGFTDEERAGFSKILDSGFLDTFRLFCDKPQQYTWWSYMSNARAKNVGWRIDYFCASESLRPLIKDAFILPHVMGSDHCPVGLTLEMK